MAREFMDGQGIYGRDVVSLARGMEGTGVVDGCAVDDGGDTDLDVEIGSGTIRVDGVTVDVVAQTVAIDAAHATLKRTDLIALDENGDAVYVAGSVSITPPGGTASLYPASLPSNARVVLAHVTVPALAAGVDNTNIRDSRTMLRPEQATIVRRVETGDYTLQATDGGRIIYFDISAPATLTLPDDLPDDLIVNIMNDGTDVLTIEADGTLVGAAAFNLNNQYDLVTVIHRGGNVWVAKGDLAA